MSSPEIPRYCTGCGEIFDAQEPTCPNCDARWPRRLPINFIETYAFLLTEIADLHHEGRIDEAVYERLRTLYEDRLKDVRPRRRDPDRAMGVAPAQATPAVAQAQPVRPPRPAPRPTWEPVATGPMPAPVSPPPPFRPVAPPAPPRPPRRPIAAPLLDWAARRQADLLLYLGAFLLSISAIVFIDYQGSLISGLTKSVILALYTSAFLGLGVTIRRWERVREAGPVFTGLGALLTPLNFILLYTAVLRDGETPQSWIWLSGSLATAGLYALLARRGFGRYYYVPAGAGALLAWGSLGAVLDIPMAWYGPWFVLLAGALNLGAARITPRFADWREYGSAAVGAGALVFAHIALVTATDVLSTADRLALPTAYLLAIGFLLPVALPSRRTAPLAALPALASLAAMTACWTMPAIGVAAFEWAPLFALLAAGGYLGLTLLRPDLTRALGATALAIGAVALLYAHSGVATGHEPLILPAAYAAATLLAAIAYARSGSRLPLSLLPALGVATVTTALWAVESFSFDWLGVVSAVIALGYMALAQLDQPGTRRWRGAAAGFAAPALLLAHLTALVPETVAWQLSATYAILLAGLVLDSLRFRPSALAAPIVAGVLGGTILWALGVETAAWPLPAAILALLAALSSQTWANDRRIGPGGWPIALGLALAPITFFEAYAGAPAYGLAAMATSSLTMLTAALLSSGGLAGLFGFAGERANTIEQQALARAGGWFALAAAGYANALAGLSPSDGAWTFAATGAALWLAVPLLRTRFAGADTVLGPVGLTALGVAVLVSVSTPEIAALVLAGAAAIAVVAARGHYATAWRATAAGLGLTALAFAEGAATALGTDAWQVPSAAWILLAAATWDVAVNRYALSWFSLPVVVTVAAGSVVWWQEWPAYHWVWAPLASSAALAVAGRRLPFAPGVSALYALGLAGAPVLAAGLYLTEPWAGLTAFATSAAIWFGIAVRRPADLSRLLALPVHDSAIRAERALLAGGGAMLLAAATGYANAVAGLSPADAVWVFAGGAAAALAALRLGRTWFAHLDELVSPPAALFFAIAGVLTFDNPEVGTLVAAVAALFAAIAAGGRYAAAWRAALAGSATLALLLGQAAADASGLVAGELALAAALVLAAALWDAGVNRFAYSWLAVPVLGSLAAAVTVLWQEWPTLHAIWTPLAFAVAIAALDRRLPVPERLREDVRWPYALGLALLPLAAVSGYEAEPWAGALAFAIAASVWAWGSATSGGSLSAALGLAATDRAVAVDRQVLGITAAALAFIGLGYLNATLGIPPLDAAWTYATVAIVALAARVIVPAGVRGLDSVLLATGLGALAIATALAASSPGAAAIILSAGSLALVAGAIALRHEPSYLIGYGTAVAASLAGWAALDLPAWSLGPVHAVAAAAIFAALATQRRAEPMPRLVAILSVLPIGVALALAGLGVLAQTADALATTGPIASPEWRALAAVVAVGGLMLTAEGIWRLGRDAVIAGTVALLVALEMAIASFEPANVQAHTVPMALYLVALGLGIRRSAPFVSQHMYQHEAFIALGAAFLVVPMAEQALSPGGEHLGILLLAEAIGLLAIGLVLAQRWLVTAGVLTLAGVAIRYVFAGDSATTVPYWVWLGLAGLLLVGLGMLVLIQRDWWDRSRTRLMTWWLHGAGV